MPSRQHDFIIIGQGLAGSILAYTLIEHGQSVLVIDNQHEGSASVVAAGIINPITGHRLNISDRFAEYYSCAERYYGDLEHSTKQRFWYPVKQTRLIKNEGQRDYLKRRLTEPAYDHLLGPQSYSIFNNAEFGEIEVLKTATVDATAVLRELKTWLITHQAYKQDKVDYQSIVKTNLGFQVGGARAERLIFCEGYQAIYNPWLKHLPFKLAKGEILSLDTTASIDNSLLSWGQWLVNSNNTTKLGSNFIWNDLTLKPSQASREKLLKSLLDNTNIDAVVTDHKVGIRPTTTQRKPFIGEIDSLKQAFCFNGFGSKGCLLIPYYTQLFTRHLVGSDSLPDELTQWI